MKTDVTAVAVDVLVDALPDKATLASEDREKIASEMIAKLQEWKAEPPSEIDVSRKAVSDSFAPVKERCSKLHAGARQEVAEFEKFGKNVVAWVASRETDPDAALSAIDHKLAMVSHECGQDKETVAALEAAAETVKAQIK